MTEMSQRKKQSEHDVTEDLDHCMFSVKIVFLEAGT